MSCGLNCCEEKMTITESSPDQRRKLQEVKPPVAGGLAIQDQTETNLINLRRTIYLTIMSSMDFEEAGHKLMKIELGPGQEMEIVTMVIECCSQEKTYLRYRPSARSTPHWHHTLTLFPKSCSLAAFSRNGIVTWPSPGTLSERPSENLKSVRLACRQAQVRWSCHLGTYLQCTLSCIEVAMLYLKGWSVRCHSVSCCCFHMAVPGSSRVPL